MEKELDKLLQSKYDQKRKAEWKSQIPMPTAMQLAEKKIGLYKGVKLGLLAVILICVSLAAFYFYNSGDSNSKLIDEYINTTPIVFVDDLNPRSAGLEKQTQDKTELNFYKAIGILKDDSPQIKDAISLLDEVSKTKNKHQIEALWYKALASAKINDNASALNDLQKLVTISNFQNEKAKKLINQIKKRK